MTAVVSIGYLFGCATALYLVMARERDTRSYMGMMMLVGTARFAINLTKVQALSASPNAAGDAARVLVDWIRCQASREQERSLLPISKAGAGQEKISTPPTHPSLRGSKNVSTHAPLSHIRWWNHAAPSTRRPPST